MKATDYIRKDNARTLTGTLRPSGRFSVCQIFPKKCKGFKNVKEKVPTSASVLPVRRIDEAYARLTGLDGSSVHEVREAIPEPSGGFGLSIAANSNSKAKRGSKGIGVRQRDVLCWSANTLERVYRRQTMSFLTLTLPELTSNDLKSIQEHWSEVVHTVLIYLQREFKKHGLVTHIVGCTEIQLERKERTGLSYPHLHLVFRGRFHGRAGWAVSPGGFREIWRRVCSRFLSVGSYRWGSCENVQQVNKSCGGYLAKYISKAASKQGKDGGGDWHPNDWIICSRKLRGLYEQLTRKGYELGEVLLAVVREFPSGCGYKRPIVISSAAYGDREIGWWGWLKDEMTFPDFAQIHAA